MYYDDDEDDDPYTPRIGPAAMPSPRSRFAPYYSGCTNTFEDFLEDFEGRAYDCALTDPQQVDTLIRYVDPSLRELCRTLDGSRSRDWPRFRQSLINIFGSITPRPQVMRQRLLNYVQDSSRARMNCADNVSRYYRQFLCLGEPLVHSGHLTEDDRNAAFWYGFHPEDREILWPRLLGKNPLQPLDVPFHFEDVFRCARAAFAYDNYFPSPWSQKLKFEPSSVRLTRTVATYTETTPDELSPSSHSTSDTQPPSSSSHSASESQHTQAPSVTLDQPEPAYTLSTTLPPSASFSTLFHASSLARSTVDNDPIPASTPPPFSLIPSAFPTPTHTDSLARSDAEISSIHPLSSIMLASTMPSISSNFDYPSSATVDQPAPTLLSTPPSSSSISPTFVPSATEDQSEPEPAPALFASIPTMSSTPSHVHSAINNFASTPPSSSPTSSTCLPTVTEEQPEPEPEPIPLIAPASTFASTPLPSSSSTFLPTPVISATDCQPASEPASASPVSKFDLTLRVLPLSPDQKLDLLPRALSPPPGCLLVLPISSPTLSSLPLPEISSLGSGSLLVAPSPDQPSSLLESLSQLSRPCELESSTPASAADVVTLSRPELSESSQDEFISSLPASLEAPPIAPISPHSTPSQRPPGLETFDSDSSPLEIPLAPANLAPSHSTFALLPVLPASSDFPSASASPSLVLGDLELESFPTPSPAVDIIPLSQPESSWSPVYEPVLFLPASLEAPPITPISPHSTSPRLPGPETVGSDSFPFEIAPPIASSVPRRGCQEPSLPHEVQSIKPPALAPRPSLFHPSPSLRLFGTSARFGFALALVTAAVLASILNISAIVSTFARRFQSKIEDTGNSQIGTFNTSSRNGFAQRLRLGQYTPRALRFVFDPGGQSSSSSPSVQVSSFGTRRCSPAQVEDTRRLHHHTHNTSLPTPIPTDNLAVFDPGSGAFVLEPSHEDSATFDEDAQRLCLHARGHLSYYNSHFLRFRL